MHDLLESELRERTFFDTQVKEELKEESKEAGEPSNEIEFGASLNDQEELPEAQPLDLIRSSLSLNPDLRLSSLDLTVYAYLKEELINTSNTKEVKYLK